MKETLNWEIDYDEDDREVWERHEIGPDDVARGLRMAREIAESILAEQQWREE